MIRSKTYSQIRHVDLARRVMSQGATFSPSADWQYIGDRFSDKLAHRLEVFSIFAEGELGRPGGSEAERSCE